MRRVISGVICVVAILPAAGGMAEAAEAAGTWKADAELGVLTTHGNTNTKNITAKLKVVNNRDRWRHTFRTEALNSSDQGSTTAERYFVSGKSDYKLTTKSYAFGLLTYENDRFSGYDHRTTETLGYGRNLIQKEVLSLDLEGGLGARQSKLSGGGGTQYEGLIHLGGGLKWKISDSATFSEDLSSDIGRKGTVSQSVTALKSQIIGSLASKISFTAKYSSQVPPDVTKLDTETAVTLVYGF